jgi:hypothetical protein
MQKLFCFLWSHPIPGGHDFNQKKLPCKLKHIWFSGCWEESLKDIPYINIGKNFFLCGSVQPPIAIFLKDWFCTMLPCKIQLFLHFYHDVTFEEYLRHAYETFVRYVLRYVLRYKLGTPKYERRSCFMMSSDDIFWICKLGCPITSSKHFLFYGVA